jgi:hypothetical protein
MNRCSSLIQLGCIHLSPYIVLLILGGGGGATCVHSCCLKIVGPSKNSFLLVVAIK